MYAECFLMPVKTAQKDQYKKFATISGKVFKENGALSVTECWAVDAPMGKVTSFPRAVQLAGDETVVISWITFPDKATRDAAVSATMADKRVSDVMNDIPVDGRRMVFGGFESIVAL